MKIQTLGYTSLSKNTWILISGSLITILFSLLPLEQSFPLLIIFSGLLLGAIIILLDSPEEFNSIFFLFTMGFLIRVLVSAFLYFTSTILQKEGGFFLGDGCNYSLNGWRISQLWDIGINVNKSNFLSKFTSVSGTIGNYDFLNAAIYSISGYSPFSLFFMNCLAGSLSIILIFIISNKIFNKKIALLSSAFCAFWPSFILWSSQNIKDPLTNLGILFFLYFFLKLQYSFKISSILFLLLSLAGLYYLRIFILLPLVISSLIYFLFCSNHKKEIKVAFAILLIIIVFLLFKRVFVSYFKESFFELLDTERFTRSYGRLAYFPDFRISSLGSLLVYLPLGIFAVWLSPFPWQLFSLSQIFAAPETLVWYLLLPFGIKGMYIAIKNKAKDSYLLIATILAFSVFLAIYEGNLGTMYRHKTIVVALTFIFISLGLHSRLHTNSLCKSHYLT